MFLFPGRDFLNFVPSAVRDYESGALVAAVGDGHGVATVSLAPIGPQEPCWLPGGGRPSPVTMRLQASTTI
ncbi:hypothetical protein [Streptomyces sp. AC550_RSS872]|uniref:hypothetical protein n=1 Tax=Streptomyces sp. AC550_RSS872 TaxID=2823689 RepID=UPI001C27E9BD|nr:hypothetical protein [Streptomyces sp. AC550_RSS872]